MKLGFWDYVKAAFSARPVGMFIPPNWIGLGVAGLLGFLNPGFWVIGAGLELGYLLWLSTNPRFQRTVLGEALSRVRKGAEAKTSDFLQDLTVEDQRRYREVERQCMTVLRQQEGTPGVDVHAPGEGLGKVLWMFLQLLLARQTVQRSLDELIQSEIRAQGALFRRRLESGRAGSEPGCALLEERVRDLEEKVKQEKITDEVRKSLAGQVEILQQRLANRKSGLEKLAFFDAELLRIEEQVKLIREQAALTADPASLSSRIDQVLVTLGGTSQTIAEHQRQYGNMAALTEKPPPLIAPSRERAREAP